MRRALCFLLVAAAPLAAQSSPDICRAATRFTVGQYAEYRMTGGRAEGSTIRLAIVGEERRADTTWHRYEVGTAPSGDASQRTVMQMTVAGLGTLEFAVRDIAMKSGDEPPMRMPDGMARMVSGQLGRGIASEMARRCTEAGVTMVGWESVTVPAGTFRAMHVKTADGEAWTLAEGLGLVKSVGKDGTTMELTARGTGAKPSFD